MFINQAVSEGQCSSKPKVKVGEKAPRRLTPWISYELFMWTWFLTLTILAIVDRFTWNVWPRQMYSIGAGSAGSDRLEGFKPGPWSVKVYDCMARISGRYSILAYNFLLITRLESLEWFLTTRIVSKYILDTKNIVNANLRMHAWSGVALCALTLLHIWTILLPCVTHGYGAVVVPGKFEWPLSERTPVKCSVEDVPGCWPGDANIENKTMGLQVDDVWRLVEMTVLLCILMPISIRWLATRWHAGIQIHRFINVAYFVDIVRRHSHPHSWILNTPIFCIYLLDKLVWAKFFHRNNNPEVKKVKLGNDFMVLYWKSPFGITDTVGPDYALRLHNSSILEDKHVFTCFENRSEGSGGEDEDGFDWTVGVVIRVFRRPRWPQTGRRDVHSHTQRMYDEEPNLLITGPRQGEMSEFIKLGLIAKDSKPLVLVGAGSAINFILDSLHWCCKNTPGNNNVSIVYTTRDLHLFEWSKKAVSTLLVLCESKNIHFDVSFAYTGWDDKSGGWFDASVEEPEDAGIKVIEGRVDLYQVIVPGSIVFCQGAAGLKSSVKSVCNKVKAAAFHGGRGGF